MVPSDFRRGRGGPISPTLTYGPSDSSRRRVGLPPTDPCYRRDPQLPQTGCVCLSGCISAGASVTLQYFLYHCSKLFKHYPLNPICHRAHRCQGPASPGLQSNWLAKTLCQTTGQIKSKRALAPRGKMHISFDLLHEARLQERKQRLLSLQGAMKNELGPLLREGMEENLSFWVVVLSHLARRK